MHLHPALRGRYCLVIGAGRPVVARLFVNLHNLSNFTFLDVNNDFMSGLACALPTPPRSLRETHDNEQHHLPRSGTTVVLSLARDACTPLIWSRRPRQQSQQQHASCSGRSRTESPCTSRNRHRRCELRRSRCRHQWLASSLRYYRSTIWQTLLCQPRVRMVRRSSADMSNSSRSRDVLVLRWRTSRLCRRRSGLRLLMMTCCLATVSDVEMIRIPRPEFREKQWRRLAGRADI